MKGDLHQRARMDQATFAVDIWGGDMEHDSEGWSRWRSADDHRRWLAELSPERRAQIDREFIEGKSE